MVKRPRPCSRRTWGSGPKRYPSSHRRGDHHPSGRRSNCPNRPRPVAQHKERTAKAPSNQRGAIAHSRGKREPQPWEKATERVGKTSEGWEVTVIPFLQFEKYVHSFAYCLHVFSSVARAFAGRPARRLAGSLAKLPTGRPAGVQEGLHEDLQESLQEGLQEGLQTRRIDRPARRLTGRPVNKSCRKACKACAGSSRCWGREPCRVRASRS